MKLDVYRNEPTGKIMLTPMLDMFTTILIFLILAFSPEESKAHKSASIELPASIEKIEKMPHIQVEVTKAYVKVNSEAIPGLVPETAGTVEWGAFKDKILALDADYAQKHQAETAALDPKKPKPVLLIADKSEDFRYIDRAVAFLGAAGYSQVFLLTETKGEKRELAQAQGEGQ